MAEEPTTTEQITEYESQLAGIVDLLDASPCDESLLALKLDMEELLELSRANVADDTTTTAASIVGDIDGQSKAEIALEELQLPHPPLPPPPPHATSTGIVDGALSSNAALPPSAGLQNEIHNQDVPSENAITSGEISAVSAVSASKKEKTHKAKKSSIKKQKKVKDFVLPDHLLPNEEDTDPERNKKRRAAKQLKNSWRQKKKRNRINESSKILAVL